MADLSLSQRCRRIGGRRGSRGQHSRRERHAEHEQSGAPKPDRIGTADAEQHAGQDPRQRAYCGETDLFAGSSIAIVLALETDPDRAVVVAQWLLIRERDGLHA